MNKIDPTYVTFEQAKLLKEKEYKQFKIKQNENTLFLLWC